MSTPYGELSVCFRDAPSTLTAFVLAMTDQFFERDWTAPSSREVPNFHYFHSVGLCPGTDGKPGKLRFRLSALCSLQNYHPPKLATAIHAILHNSQMSEWNDGEVGLLDRVISKINPNLPPERQLSFMRASRGAPSSELKDFCNSCPLMYTKCPIATAIRSRSAMHALSQADTYISAVNSNRLVLNPTKEGDDVPPSYAPDAFDLEVVADTLLVPGTLGIVLSMLLMNSAFSPASLRERHLPNPAGRCSEPIDVAYLSNSHCINPRYNVTRFFLRIVSPHELRRIALASNVQFKASDSGESVLRLLQNAECAAGLISEVSVKFGKQNQSARGYAEKLKDYLNTNKNIYEIASREAGSRDMEHLTIKKRS